MLELKNSGLPVFLKEDSSKLEFKASLKYDSYGRKYIEQMVGLLADENNLELSDKFYDVYRGICFLIDEALFHEKAFQYDITVVMDGLINGECKKTSGHFHGFNPKGTHTYPEVYEVIYGKALYILQKANNFESDYEHIELQDVILVNVEAGQTIIIPPDYGHCSINIGEGPMIFSNLAYVPCPVFYDAVRHYHGMSFYVLKKDGEVVIQGNPLYPQVPKPKFATIRENETLGIKFGCPVYESFLKNPDAFDFLGNPDSYIENIMSMLIYRETY